MTSAGTTVVEQIDAMLAQRDPAQQHVLVSMSEGRLSRDEVRALAAQYFHLIDALPRFVSTVHAVTIAHPAIRRTLLNVLMPLELHPPSVADLWLQTCAALGLFSDSVRKGEPTSATIACLSDFEYLCQAGTAQGLAALYAWMTRLPQVCRIEQQAFAAHYDLKSGPGVHFFEVVGFQAESHARELRTALVALLDQYPEAGPSSIDAAQAAVIAVEGMYLGALANAGR
ncbi:MAG: Pyrroloquinoline quinone [Thermoleophilia bacterium]|nr:Pyrroloquinoline quinone [Thermoleophilia bacterium]